MNGHCPNCEKVLVRHAHLHDKSLQPRPGDYTVCGHCRTVLQIEEGPNFRKVNLEDLANELRAEIEGILEWLNEKMGFAE